MPVKLILNSAQCTSCGDVLVSRHRHDYVVCQCGNVAVDGGLDYMRMSVKDLGHYKSLHQYEHIMPVVKSDEDDGA